MPDASVSSCVLSVYRTLSFPEPEGGKVMVNDATVTATDIEASNGVIHVIDKVILPAP